MERRPLCCIVTGRPGAGKTTLAMVISHELRIPLLSRDSLKEGLVHTKGVGHDQLAGDANLRTTEAFFETALLLLSRGISLVIEAAFQQPTWESKLSAIKALGEPVVILCQCDQEIATNRQELRAERDPMRRYFHGEPMTAYIDPALDVPTLLVRTEQSHSPSIEDIVRFVKIRGEGV